MTNKELLDEVLNCARLYEDNLEGKNILFVYQNKGSTITKEDIQFIETVYYSSNFLHLTGLKSKLNSKLFYKKLISHKLSISDFQIKIDI